MAGGAGDRRRPGVRRPPGHAGQRPRRRPDYTAPVLARRDGPAGDPRPRQGAHLEWTLDLSEETLGAPVTDGQRAYIEDSTGRLSAIDMASGTVAWATPIGTDGDNVTPILVGDAIIASATGPT